MRIKKTIYLMYKHLHYFVNAKWNRGQKVNMKPRLLYLKWHLYLSNFTLLKLPKPHFSSF